MNQIEAERELEILREKSLGYCPLIKDDCRKDCAAYFEGSVAKNPYKSNDEYEWRVYPPYCSSPVVTGEIEVSQ